VPSSIVLKAITYWGHWRLQGFGDMGREDRKMSEWKKSEKKTV
jgi:hypothetical protein